MEQKEGEKKKIRKARVQVEPKKGPTFQKEEGGMDYNIWYHSHIGHKRDRFGVELEGAKTRCNISKDSGWSIGCSQKDPYFCLYFARGCCTNGSECKFMHRLPTKQDEARIPITKDVFGRDKFSTDREDMSGVGNFNRDSKTLYITNLKNISGLDMNECITRHFKEWGRLEYVRVFQERCYAFIKYELRLCAEFAKEAMSNQSLDNQEIISIKWSQDDPNPMSQTKDLIDKRQKIIKNLEDKGIQIKEQSFQYPKDYKIEEGEKKEEKKEEKEEKEQDLDYNHYIHKTFKEQKLLERKQLEIEEKQNQEKQNLNSLVCEPYPNTDNQYN